MKLSSVLFLISFYSTSAFAPTSRRSSFKTSLPRFAETNQVDDFCETVTSKTEEVLDKADDLALNRVMRFVDHAPIIFTLRSLADKAGMSISRSGGLATGAASFGGLSTALPVSTWAFNVYALAAIAQLASVAKSTLADDGNELNQGTITATAATNWLVTRAVGSANPLRDTALVALVSGHALRRGNSNGDVTIHNAALQIVSSFTTVLTIMGGVSAVTARIPLLNQYAQVTTVLGLASYYGLATRAGDGTVRKTVNAGVIAGVVYSRLAAGIKISMEPTAIVGGAITAGAAFIAYQALNRVRKAVLVDDDSGSDE